VHELATKKRLKTESLMEDKYYRHKSKGLDLKSFEGLHKYFERKQYLKMRKGLAN